MINETDAAILKQSGAQQAHKLRGPEDHEPPTGGHLSVRNAPTPSTRTRPSVHQKPGECSRLGEHSLHEAEQIPPVQVEDLDRGVDVTSFDGFLQLTVLVVDA